MRLSLGQLLLVIGAAVAVPVPDLGDRGHVDGMVDAPVAAQRQPVDLPVPGGRLDRGGAVIGGEVIASGEAGHVGHVTDDGAGDHRANAGDLGEGGAGGLDRGGQLLAGVAQLGVQAGRSARNSATGSNWSGFSSVNNVVMNSAEPRLPEGSPNYDLQNLHPKFSVVSDSEIDVTTTPGAAGFTYEIDFFTSTNEYFRNTFHGIPLFTYK